MKFTPVEIIALVLIIFSLIKIIVVLTNKNIWKKSVVKPFLKNIHLVGTTCLILAGVVLYFLLKELSIAQILASIAFTILLIAFGFSTHKDHLEKLVDKAYKDKHIIKRSLIYILIWLIILVWGLKEILF